MVWRANDDYKLNFDNQNSLVPIKFVSVNSPAKLIKIEFGLDADIICRQRAVARQIKISGLLRRRVLNKIVRRQSAEQNGIRGFKRIW